MLRRLLVRVLAVWSRPAEQLNQEAPVSALEAAGVDLDDLDLNDPEDLFTALRRVVNQADLEAWRASRVPPHMRHRTAAAKDALSVYGSVSPPVSEVHPFRPRDRAAG